MTNFTLMKFKKGDIVICTRDEFSGIKFDLDIGDKYEIYDQIDDGIIRIINKGVILFASSYMFIPIEMYRDFKLKQILE
jgi:hypothetical protein